MSANPDHFDVAHAETAWTELAARLAGRPAMRLARLTRKDGKLRAAYDRGEVPVSAALPTAPAAVLLYDATDRAEARIRVLAFDLDAKKQIEGAQAGREAAARDAAVLVDAVVGAGGRCIVSSGPTGGHHVWIPLAEPLPLQQAAALGHALQRTCPTLDPAPLGNAATGCLRPPGAPHTAGGYQALLTPLPEALDALDRPGGPQVVEALWALVGPVPSARPVAATVPEDRRPLPAKWEQLASRGPQPGEYRGDDSLARWHLTLAAVRAGWSPDEWVAAISGWPWLSGQLSSPRRLQLARAEFEKAAGQWRQGGSVQIPDTSPLPVHGGGGPFDTESTCRAQPPDVHRELRKVRTWLAGKARSGGMSPCVHAVARGVLLFAHATGSARIQVGVRALAIAAGVSRTTAGAALWELEAAGLVSRVGRGVGRGADVWEVDLGLGRDLPPARGTIWATRPVFRVIGGHGAAEVYEVLACSGSALSSRGVAGMLGRSPTTVSAHLQELAGWGLAAGGGREGWRVGPSDPDELARRLGATEIVASQVARFRAERLAWWAWLESTGAERPGRRAAGIGQVAILPHVPQQRHQPAARGDRAGPDWSVAAAVALVGAALGGVVIGERRQLEAALAE